MPRSDESVATGLRVRGLACERGGRTLFGPCELDVAQGALLIVSGPNGSGKTTLLRAVAGLVEAQCEEARWVREAGALRSAPWRARICYAGHRIGHKDDLSVDENLELACALQGRETALAERTQVLQRLGLAQRAALAVKRLSQGQKQRLTLARCVLSTRPLWLLDEPTSALDAEGRSLFLQILDEHLERGGAALVATHERLEMRGRPVAELRLG
jgi:heme exporter protein A